MPRTRLLFAAVGAVVALAACGGGEESQVPVGADASSGEAPSEAAPLPGDADATSDADPAFTAPAGTADVPDVDVPDVTVLSVPSGDEVNLRELALGNDTLFWFWAPH